MKKIRLNSVVIFDPESFHQNYWNKLSEHLRKRYYGILGYGSKKPKHFVYLGEIKNAPGHCILVDMDTNEVLTMYHTWNFREVTDSEF